MTTFALLLRQHRRLRELTQADLAHVLGVTQSAVSSWENEDEPTIPWPRMRDLVSVFGWSAPLLANALGWYEDGRPPPTPPEIQKRWAKVAPPADAAASFKFWVSEGQPADMIPTMERMLAEAKARQAAAESEAGRG